jgi:spore maturation protein CgeB
MIIFVLLPLQPYIVICESGLELAKKVLYYIDHPQEEEKKIKEGYAWVKKTTMG